MNLMNHKTLQDIIDYQQKILDRIMLISKENSDRDVFYKSIIEDLFGALLLIKRYSEYTFSENNMVAILERKSFYSEWLAWYRKLIEHLYYTILLETEIGWDEKYKGYILYRTYDYYRRILKSDKNDYGIKKDKKKSENHPSQFYGNFLDMACIINNWNFHIPKILKNTNTKEEINPFRFLSEIHLYVFKEATPNEKILIWWKSYETAYGLSCNSIHSNPTEFHHLDFSSWYQLEWFLIDILFALINCIYQRYTKEISYEKPLIYDKIFGFQYKVWEFLKKYGTVKSIHDVDWEKVIEFTSQYWMIQKIPAHRLVYKN